MPRHSNGDIIEYHNGEVKQGQEFRDCAICGFEYPKKKMRMHYVIQKLVCPRCYDPKPKVGDIK